MKVQLIAIGTRMPNWITMAFNDYLQRLPYELKLSLKEIPLAKRHQNQTSTRAIEQEGQAMLASIPKSSWVVSLDVQGQAWDSLQLATQLYHWQQDHKQLCFLIGGPDGLAPSCQARANERWSLSPLTLPHALARIILIEQFYRANCINQGHPYHRS